MADAPLALWVVFICLTIPLIDLATVSLRSTLLVMVSREAANAAARCKTFKTSLGPDEPSSCDAASNRAYEIASKFSEIRVSDVKTYIVVTNIDSGSSTRQSSRLSQPADTAENLYLVEVEVSGQTSPLIPFSGGGLFGNVPGLTAPVSLTVASRQYHEYPQGLNQ